MEIDLTVFHSLPQYLIPDFSEMKSKYICLESKKPVFIVIFMFGCFKDFIYLFILERGEGGRKRGRETSMCGCLSCAPYWGCGPQPSHVP